MAAVEKLNCGVCQKPASHIIVDAWNRYTLADNAEKHFALKCSECFTAEESLWEQVARDVHIIEIAKLPSLLRARLT